MRLKPYAMSALMVILLIFMVDQSECDGAQVPDVIYDESKVPGYTLPDPLRMENGRMVHDAKQWIKERRPELLELFATHVYGHVPKGAKKLRYEVISSASGVLEGLATRRQVRIWASDAETSPKMDLLMYIPSGRRSAPVVLGLNFSGNHTIHPDAGILLAESWIRSDPEAGITNNRATERARGKSVGRWPVETILKRGFALATIYYGDIEPDHPEGWKTGFRGHLGSGGDWGAISAWSWGLSRAMDYLETDESINPHQVALIGHSRLGKTALWAGATDQRFAAVISNNSGCGGAALSRRRYGETVQRITTAFPHWFCPRFKEYNGKEDDLPVDQHQLIALIAPRPVYVASAEEDRWADPKGEFLSAKLAEPVYALFGKSGTGVDALPPVNKPVGGSIGYHIRTGKHDITEYDWDQYLGFLERHFRQPR